MKTFRIEFLLALTLFSVWLAEPIIASADSGSTASTVTTTNPIIEWNRNLLALVRTVGAQPRTIHPTCNFAIMHAAM